MRIFFYIIVFNKEAFLIYGFHSLVTEIRKKVAKSGKIWVKMQKKSNL